VRLIVHPFILQTFYRKHLKAFQHTALEDTSYTSLAGLIVDTKFAKGQVLFQEGKGTNATLYIVREGQVKLTSTAHAQYKDMIIKQGGLFGEEMLERDAQKGVNPSSEPLVKAKYTATVTEDCILGCLTLAECRTILDTTTIGKSTRSTRFQSIVNDDIPMSALTRHAILGAGTFGQVWLVSRVTSNGGRKAYALKIQSKYELVRNSQARGVVQKRILWHSFTIPSSLILLRRMPTSRGCTCCWSWCKVASCSHSCTGPIAIAFLRWKQSFMPHVSWKGWDTCTVAVFYTAI
jgi:hypothetical protein